MLDSLSEELELIEIALIVLVCFIGSCVHEYLFKQEHQPFTLKNINLWISTFISTILCYIINPWIIDFNPRLVLLPPLLLGLAGMDLVKRLTTVKGSSSILEYILGFFGIRNQKDGENYGIPDNEETSSNNAKNNDDSSNTIDSSQFENIMILDDEIHNCLTELCNILVEYYVHKDKVLFLKVYHQIKINIELLHHKILSYKMIPMTTSLKLSEIMKKEMELDTVYHEITAKEQ